MATHLGVELPGHLVGNILRKRQADCTMAAPVASSSQPEETQSLGPVGGGPGGSSWNMHAYPQGDPAGLSPLLEL